MSRGMKEKKDRRRGLSRQHSSFIEHERRWWLCCRCGVRQMSAKPTVLLCPTCGEADRLRTELEVTVRHLDETQAVATQRLAMLKDVEADLAVKEGLLKAALEKLNAIEASHASLFSAIKCTPPDYHVTLVGPRAMSCQCGAIPYGNTVPQ